MARKITKKEIEEPDSFQQALNKITQYISANRRTVYTACGVLVLAVVAFTGWYLYRMNYNEKAGRLYAMAELASIRTAREGGAYQNNIKMYNDIISQYPGSKTAALSYYQLGNLYYNLGDMDASIGAYGEFLKDASDTGDLKVLAYNGLGYCYERKGDFPRALESFEKAADSKSSVGFEATTYSNMARIYDEMKNKEKALEYYQKALTSAADPSTQLFLKKMISNIN